MKKVDKSEGALRFPDQVLLPIKKFLLNEVKRMQRRKKELEKSDPFHDSQRASNNSLEEDVDEQLGHSDVEAKAKFLSIQIVKMRKALTRMKLGRYGICVKCGQMIDTDRLAVRPEASTCIKCREEIES